LRAKHTSRSQYTFPHKIYINCRQTSIYGIRYLCSVYANYDLCPDCITRAESPWNTLCCRCRERSKKCRFTTVIIPPSSGRSVHIGRQPYLTRQAVKAAKPALPYRTAHRYGGRYQNSATPAAQATILRVAETFGSDLLTHITSQTGGDAALLSLCAIPESHFAYNCSASYLLDRSDDAAVRNQQEMFSEDSSGGH
jgi:hypothetical protein